MQQVYEHIREDEELMIDFMRIIREIENAGDPKWHPDTRKEATTKKKVELWQKLVDLYQEGERDDEEDKDEKLLYELCEQSDNFRKELVDYLITYDTLPFLNWYPTEDKIGEVFIDRLEEKEVDLEGILACARFFGLHITDKDQSIEAFVKGINEILKNYNLDFKI